MNESLNLSGQGYVTQQSYEYDGLYQLTGATGMYEEKSFDSSGFISEDTQSFSYDTLGNMLSKRGRAATDPLCV